MKFKVTVRKMVSETKWKEASSSHFNSEVQMMQWFHSEVNFHLSKGQGNYFPMSEPITITASEEGGKVWATFQIR